MSESSHPIPVGYEPCQLIVRHPDYEDEVTLYGVDLRTIYLDLGADFNGRPSDREQYENFAEGARLQCMGLSEDHPARQDVEEQLAYLREDIEDAERRASNAKALLRAPGPRYRVYNMHGPTVFANDSLGAAMDRAREASGSSHHPSGVYRVIDTTTGEAVGGYREGEEILIHSNPANQTVEER